MTEPAPLSAGEQKTLLEIARSTVEAYVREGRRPEFDPAEERLRDKAGCFVTLHNRRGQLRGCIGTFEADRPMYVNVRDMAIQAATRDPRFPAVTEAELGDLQLEVSVLSPRWEIADPAAEVEVGKHGLYITRGLNRGVLLPQVATEQGWNRETFLDHVCLKAGLPSGTWKDPDAKIEVFTAQVFGEE